MKPRFFSRKYEKLLMQPAGIFKVGEVSRGENGGPVAARMTATGSRSDVDKLIEQLGAPIELIDDDGTIRWHGKVHTVVVRYGRFTKTATIDQIRNRVKVVYTVYDPNPELSAGKGEETVYYEDAQSIAEYGAFEHIITMDNTSASAAVNAAQKEVATYGLPVADPAPQRTPQQVPTAEIECVGHDYVLSRRYYSRAPIGVIVQRDDADPPITFVTSRGQYRFVTGTTEIIEQDTINVGCATFTANQTPRMYFTFVATDPGFGAITQLKKLSLKCAKIGTPVDEFFANITTDEAGTQVVGTAKLATAPLTANSQAWTTWEVTYGPTLIIPGRTYYCHITRAGALSDANYLRFANTIDLNATSSMTRVWNGSAWVTNSGGDRDTLHDIEFEAPAFGLPIGAGPSTLRYWREIVISDTPGIGEVKVFLSRSSQSNPTDNLECHICAKSGSTLTFPGIAYASMPAASIPNYETEITFANFNYTGTIPNGTYAIVITRTGSADAKNLVTLHPKRIASPVVVFGRDNGTTASDLQYQDMLVKASFYHDTIRQIKDIVSAKGGSDIVGVDCGFSSGINTNPYRDGRGDALSIIVDLLRSGTSGGQRLLYEITPQRYLRIFTQPFSNPQTDLYLDEDNRLTNWLGHVIPKDSCPAGIWIRLQNALSDAITSTRMIQSTTQFVGLATYTSEDDFYLPARSDAETNLFGVRQG